MLIDGAYRNGISVIAASGLLVEHSIIQNTVRRPFCTTCFQERTINRSLRLVGSKQRGTDPEAGLDVSNPAWVVPLVQCGPVHKQLSVSLFNVDWLSLSQWVLSHGACNRLQIEPNPCNPATCKHVNFVAGIVFSNVSFQDNFGGGIHVSLGENLGNATMPIGVHIDNCHINGTGFTGPLLATQTALGLGLGVGGAEPNAVTVTGAKIGSPFVNSGEIRFTNLSVANASGGVGLIIESVPAVSRKRRCTE